MTWQLTRAGSADLTAIMELENASFASDAWSVDAMRSEITSEHCYYLVAFPVGNPSRLDGYAGLFAPRGGTQADIQTIAVGEHVRRQGLGRVLMLSLMNEARNRGVREIFLEVRADNPAAQTLYQQLGFERLGVRTAYYQPDGVDAIVMRYRVTDPVTAVAGDLTGTDPKGIR